MTLKRKGFQMSKIAEFEKMVRDHDLTYSYSDDGAVYRAGSAAHDRIRAAARDLPEEDVRRIWNAKVDATIAEDYREPFYWRS